MEKILREILAEDKSILSRRDDLIALLDKKVPGNLSRDCAPIKKAVNLNIGEIFFVNDREVAAEKATEILKSSGMQEGRIKFVVETFSNAMPPEKKSDAPEEPEMPLIPVSIGKKTGVQPEKIPVNTVEEEKMPESEIVEEVPPEEIIEQTSRQFDALQTQTVSQPQTVPRPPVPVRTQAPVAIPSNPNQFQRQPENNLPFLEKMKQQFFTTKGRLNRKPYFFGLLKMIALSFVGGLTSGILIGIPLVLAAIVGGWMLLIRRLHDLNKSGWWALISLIPYVDVVFGLYVLLAPGTPGYNKYGENPLDE